jgi:hypothetical protein
MMGREGIPRTPEHSVSFFLFYELLKLEIIGFDQPADFMQANNLKAPRGSPSWAHPEIMAVQETTFRCGILWNTWSASCRLPHRTYMLTRTVPTTICVSNPACLIFAYTRLPSSKALEELPVH